MTIFIDKPKKGIYEPSYIDIDKESNHKIQELGSPKVTREDLKTIIGAFPPLEEQEEVQGQELDLVYTECAASLDCPEDRPLVESKYERHLYSKEDINTLDNVVIVAVVKVNSVFYDTDDREETKESI